MDNKGFLSDRHIEAFRELYKKRFGMELSYEDAHDQGMRLLNLIKALAKAPPCSDTECISRKGEKT